MRAVILAGGSGTRLRPITLGRPKPMVPLLGRPVLEHLFLYLKKQGFDDLTVTLCAGAEQVMDHFGDGSELGLRLTWAAEEEKEKPLGTAGSVKRCLSALDGEDFLVVSGDCVCDFDLKPALDLHRSRNAEATLILCRSPRPTEFGLIATGADGRVERFLEKPSWGQVDRDQVSAGLYILSPSALDGVEAGRAADFGKDVFPRLLREKRRVYGCLLEGYWRDVGRPDAYLDCVRDALEGRVKVDMGLPEREPGLWSGAPIPEGVEVRPPCWVAETVEFSGPCRIGPYAVLSDGVSLGAGTKISRSVLMENASVGPGSRLRGAVLCREAAVQRRAVLHEGVVLGENALAGDDTELGERVKLWPGQTVPAGTRLDHSITCGSQKGLLRADDGGSFRGVIGEDMGPEALVELGGILGLEGSVGLGCSDTAGARMLARAAASGIAAAGGEVLTHGLNCPAQGAWLAGRLKLPVSLFVEECRERVYLHLFDGLGLPLSHDRARKLEQALLRNEQRRVRGSKVGALRQLDWDQSRWAAETAKGAAFRRRRTPLRRVLVAVEPDSPENLALRAVLVAAGCGLEEKWRPGVPAFRAAHGGFYLSARDEKGAAADPGQLLTLVTLLEMENGGGRAAVPAGASAAVELTAAGFDGEVLRLDRDGREARTLYAALPWFRESYSAAARICAGMAASGETLGKLLGKTPRFHGWQREVPIRSHRGRVLEVLAGECGTSTAGAGLRVRTGDRWVSLTPLSRRPALRVLAEGPDLELAAELCDFYAGRAAAADRMLLEKEENSSSGI